MLKSDKYVRNLAAGLVLGLCVISLSGNANELNKLSIKRSNTSGSALNVTIFTSNPYNDNVAVTQKSDNKYVILIPNISGSNASSVDFSSIKDIVSDVNVKSIADGANGYTKVTLTTSKPVSITTSTKNSTPLTAEQKAYKNLIAQSRGYVSKNTNSQPIAKVVEEPVAQNVSSISHSAPTTAVTTASATAKATQNAIHQDDSQAKSKSVIDKLRAKADITVEKTEKANVIEPVLDKKAAVASDKELLNDIKSEVTDNKIVDTRTVSDTKPAESISDNAPVNTAYSEEQFHRKGFNTSMLTILLTLLTTAFGLIILAKAIRRQLESAVALKHSFKEHLHEEPKSAIVDCGDIMENKNLSWQQKYQTFRTRIEEVSPESGLIRAVSNGEYEYVNSSDKISTPIDNIFKTGKISPLEDFDSNTISNLKPAHKPKLTSYNAPSMNSAPKAKPIRKVKNQNLKASDFSKLEIVEEKSDSDRIDLKDLISKLDRTLKDSPSVEKLNNNSSENVIENQFKENIAKTNNSTFVHNEEEVISNNIRTAPKLKSFAQKIALEKNNRKISLPKNSSEIIKSKNIESKHVNLENSNLYSSVRKFKDANLNSSALIANNSVVSRKMTDKTDNINTKDYSLASVEDFLNESATTGNYSTVPKSLSNRVADSLGKIGKASDEDSANINNSTAKSDRTIKAGYKINDNSGFYIVSDDNGNSSLIGRINNSETILKDFNMPVTDRLQVRKDSDNIYMVRVGAERFLVELNGEKMGVLIEL